MTTHELGNDQLPDQIATKLLERIGAILDQSHANYLGKGDWPATVHALAEAYGWVTGQRSDR